MSKLLLVEDEEYIRDLYKRQLDLAGLMTDAFGLGNEGLAAAEKNSYDLILLDIMLPDINGLQILQKVKQNPVAKNTPVVLLTNLGQDAVIKQGFELGADGYLVKAAYTPDQIVQEVKNILAKKSANPTPPTAGTPPPAGTPPSGTPPQIPPSGTPPQMPPTGNPTNPPSQ